MALKSDPTDTLISALLENSIAMYNILANKQKHVEVIVPVAKKLLTQIDRIKMGQKIEATKLYMKNKIETGFKDPATEKLMSLIVQVHTDNYIENIVKFISPFLQKFKIDISEEIIHNHFTEIEKLETIGIALNMNQSYITYVKNTCK